MGEEAVIYVSKLNFKCLLCEREAKYSITFWYYRRDTKLPYEKDPLPFKTFYVCEEHYQKLKDFLPKLDPEGKTIAKFSR